MKTLRYVPFLFFLSAISCLERSAPTKPDGNFPELIQSWTNSFEEEIDSIEVYRPSTGRQYPAARYRDLFDLRSNGTCSYMVLSPVDAHYTVDGTWSASVAHDTILEIRDTIGEIHYTLKVVELKNDILRILKLH